MGSAILAIASFLNDDKVNHRQSLQRNDQAKHEDDYVRNLVLVQVTGTIRDVINEVIFPLKLRKVSKSRV